MSFHDECMFILISHKKLIKFSKEKDEYTHFPNKNQSDNKKIQSEMSYSSSNPDNSEFAGLLPKVYASQHFRRCVNCWLDFKVRVGGWLQFALGVRVTAYWSSGRV